MPKKAINLVKHHYSNLTNSHKHLPWLLVLFIFVNIFAMSMGFFMSKKTPFIHPYAGVVLASGGTAPTLALDSNIKLLVHSDTSNGSQVFIDSSSYSHTVDYFDAIAHETVVGGGPTPVFGGSSIQCVRDGRLEVVDKTNIQWGEQPLVIESWVRFNDVGNWDNFFGDGGSDNGGIWITFGPPTGARLEVFQGSSRVVDLNTGADWSGWLADTWYHFAVVYDLNGWGIFRDGVRLSYTANTAYPGPSTTPLTFGHYFDGHIDEASVSIGTDKGWINGFTPPASPYSASPTISGTEETGATLTGNYTYQDAESDPEGTSLFRWLSSDTLDGTYTPISGATSQTYVVDQAYLGKYLKFEVTPVSTISPITGNAYLSAATGAIAQGEVSPTATSLSISGTTAIGETLTGNYTYSDLNGDTESGSEYQWYRAATAEGAYSAIGGAISQTYDLVMADYQKYLKFEVTPVADTAPTTGNSATSSASAQVIGTMPILMQNGIDSNTKLLLHNDGNGTAFVDDSNNGHSIAAQGSATQSATQSKFGGKSIYFDGGANGVSIPASTDFAFGTNDFTIDFWMYFSQVRENQYFYDIGSNQEQFRLYQGYWDLYNSSGGQIFHIANTPSAASWHHIALVRSGNTFELFLDGTSLGSSTYTGTYGSSANTFMIGNYGGVIAGVALDGYVDEFRISKGVARWTENFTLPTQMYTEQVYLTGTQEVGQTLTGNYTFYDAESDSEGVSLYQWYRADGAEGAYSVISGATNITYALTSSDAAKFIKFEVTPVSTIAPTIGITATSSATIEVGAPPTATSLSIIGTTTVGETLTGNYTYFDANSDSEATSLYQWYRADTAEGTYAAISGATSQAYVATSTDLNKYLKFEVTPVADTAPTIGEVATSTSVGPIIEVAVAPVATNVSINGNAVVGQSLSGAYTYSDENNDAENLSTFRWLRSDAVDGSYVAISGATSLSYTLVSADESKYIKFEVIPKAVNAPTNGDVVLSTASDQIVSTPVSNLVPQTTGVSVSGSKLIGSVLTGGYIYSDYENDIEGSSIFRWLKADTEDGVFVAIGSATAGTYTLVGGDVNKYLKFEVTPVASTGSTTGETILSDAYGQIYDPVTVKQDFTASASTTIAIADTSSPGTAQLPTDTIVIELKDDQKLEFNDAVEADVSATSTTVSTPSGDVSIQDAIADVMGTAFTDTEVDSVQLESGIQGEPIVIAQGGLQVEIPDETEIFAPESWDGTIQPPKVEEVEIPGKSTAAVISMGAPGISLVFTKPAKIVIPSSSGNPFYTVNGIDWIEITNQCNSAEGGGFSFPSECYFKTGNQTIIWTYHFTQFGMGLTNLGLQFWNVFDGSVATSTFFGGDLIGAAGDVPSSLRIYHENSTYYIPMIATSSPYASNMRIMTNNGVMALKIFGWRSD